MGYYLGYKASAPPPATKSLLALSDLALKGFWGTSSTFSYTHALGFRYVSGQRRVVMPTCGYGAGVNDNWVTKDLYELSTPSTYAPAAPAKGGAAIVEMTEILGRYWPASEWHGKGAKEPSNHICLQAGWWDEDQQVLWYTIARNYSDDPLPFLHAVALHDDGTCTKYGPWCFNDFSSARWKQVACWLTPIPEAQRASVQNRTHLMGGNGLSVGGWGHWGLGLFAVNLPPLVESIYGGAEAYCPAGGTTVIVATTQDLSVVPTDGTAAFYFGTVVNATGSHQWYTVPTAIVNNGDGTWSVTGNQTYQAIAATSPVEWAVVRLMPDTGVPLADFTAAGSGLSWPNYFQKRPADYANVQGDLDLTADPYFGARTGEGTVVFDFSSLAPQAVDQTRITLPLSASAVDGAYVGDFVTFNNNVPAGIYGTARKIIAYAGGTRTATVDDAWPVTPTTSSRGVVRRKSIDPAIWNGVSTAIPDPSGTRGYWQTSMDQGKGPIWIDRAGVEGVLIYGRQATGSTWYHFWDTYFSWNVIDKGGANIPAASYGYHCSQFRAPAFLYDPQHLREAAAGARLANADGMEYVDGGDYRTAWGIPLYRESTAFPGYDTVFAGNLDGASQCAWIDEAANQALIMFAQHYLPGTAMAFRPLMAVFDLPAK